MKQPSGKAKLTVYASKRQPGIGLFDEVRIVLIVRDKGKLPLPGSHVDRNK